MAITSAVIVKARMFVLVMIAIIDTSRAIMKIKNKPCDNCRQY